MVRHTLGLTGCLLGLLACGQSETLGRTQLMLVVDTDIGSLDRIDFEVSEENGHTEAARAMIRAADSPFSMNVLREDGPIGPVTVAARGYSMGDVLIERRAIVSFVPGRTVVVPLHLLASCIEITCAESDTCTEQGCVDALVDATMLPDWNGAIPRLPAEDDAGRAPGDALDAGVPDAGDATPFDPETDAGSVGVVPGSSAEDGSTPDPVDPGDDASVSEEDASVSTPPPPDPGPVVPQQPTPPAPIPPDVRQCGQSGRVDVNSDVEHCGGCDNECPDTYGDHTTALCAAAKCGVVCNALWGNCDGDATNGCENYMGADELNCGGCNVRCAATEYCTWAGKCVPD